MVKLVRDKVPQLIMKSGKRPHIHYANYNEYVNALNQKLVDKAAVFQLKPGIDEMANILEVVSAICRVNRYPRSVVERRRRSKRMELGLFRKGIILDKIE